MKLLIRRGQRDGMLGMGKVVFELAVRTELTDKERECIKKYKLGKEVLYMKNEMPIVDGQTFKGLGQLLVARALNIIVTVNDLVDGKKLECKDILEMLAVEEQIRFAGKAFNAMLIAAANFGGEEVIDLAA